MKSRAALSNCLIFAVLLWLRRCRKACEPEIYIRKSRYGRFPHFGYQEERRGKNRKVSYKPLRPVDRLLPPLLFLGGVRWGDSPPPVLPSQDGR